MTEHKHAELIHAWADGAEIEVYYEGQWKLARTPVWTREKYRIKPQHYKLSAFDWKRVLNEEFYVRYNGLDELVQLSAVDVTNGEVTLFCDDDLCEIETAELVREVGIRQPHFLNDIHPIGKTVVLVQEHNCFYDSICMLAESVDWNTVKEYIVLESE